MGEARLKPICTKCKKPLRRTRPENVEPQLLFHHDAKGNHWGWRGTACCSVLCAAESWALKCSTMDWDPEILNPTKGPLP